MTIMNPRWQTSGKNDGPTHIQWLTVTTAMVLALSSGCGAKYDTVVVEGTITYGGEKVMNGDIRFYPEGIAGGATSGAPIVDGHYEAKNKGGLVAGTHRAVIRAFILEKTGPVAAQAADADLLSGPSKRRVKPALPLYRVEGRDQFIPPRYNAKSELFVEVTGEENPQTVDFNLDREGK